MAGIEIEIDPKDVIIDTYPNNKGKGMQTGNISNGIQITHKPTGITVVCDKYRHMHKNKEEAFIMLIKELLY